MKPRSHFRNTRLQLARVITAICLFGSIAGTVVACDSRTGEGDSEADRNQLVLLSSLLTSATDFAAACNRSTQAGFACAENTGLPQSLARQTYAQVAQLAFGLDATPDATTVATFCADTFNAALFLRASATTRTCWFQCEADFWNGAISADPTTCNGVDYTALATRAPTEVAVCFNRCVSNSTIFYY